MLSLLWDKELRDQEQWSNLTEITQLVMTKLAFKPSHFALKSMLILIDHVSKNLQYNKYLMSNYIFLVLPEKKSSWYCGFGTS